MIAMIGPADGASRTSRVPHYDHCEGAAEALRSRRHACTRVHVGSHGKIKGEVSNGRRGANARTKFEMNGVRVYPDWRDEQSGSVVGKSI